MPSDECGTLGKAVHVYHAFIVALIQCQLVALAAPSILAATYCREVGLLVKLMNATAYQTRFERAEHWQTEASAERHPSRP